MDIFLLFFLLVIFAVLANIAYLVLQKKRRTVDSYHDAIVKSFSYLENPVLIDDKDFVLPQITHPVYQKIFHEFSSLVVGQEELATFFLLALLTDGHLLLE